MAELKHAPFWLTVFAGRSRTSRDQCRPWQFVRLRAAGALCLKPKASLFRLSFFRTS